MQRLRWQGRASWESILIGLGVIFYLFVFPHGIGGDGYARYAGLRSLLDEGKVPELVYSLVGPLLSAPLLLLGHFVKDQHWWMSRFNTFVFLGSVWVFVRWFTRDWKADRRLLLVLLLFCASMFPKHVTDYYSEVLSACFLALAVVAWSRDRFWAGLALVCLSVWNTPGTLIGGGFVFLYFAFRKQRLRYFFAAALLPAGIMLENFWKFGELFPNTYLAHNTFASQLPYSGLPGFSYPFFFGVLSVLFAYGKGLLFYTPGLLALFHPALWKLKGEEGDFVRAGALYLGGLILVFSRWWAWHGDWFWGPRFYLFASFLAPVLLTLLWRRAELSLAWRVALWVMALFSFWAGCQGVLFGQDFLEDCYKYGKESIGFMCLYVPEYSPLWRPFVADGVRLSGRKPAYLAFFLIVAVTVLWPAAREIFTAAWERARAFTRRHWAEGRWRV